MPKGETKRTICQYGCRAGIKLEDGRVRACKCHLFEEDSDAAAAVDAMIESLAEVYTGILPSGTVADALDRLVGRTNKPMRGDLGADQTYEERLLYAAARLEECGDHRLVVQARHHLANKPRPFVHSALEVMQIAVESIQSPPDAEKRARFIAARDAIALAAAVKPQS